MILEKVVVEGQVNCYILAEAAGSPAVIIDPGSGERDIRRALARHDLQPGAVVNTHGHFDHIGCDGKFGVPVYIHRRDEELLKDASLNLSVFFSSQPYVIGEDVLVKTVEEGDRIRVGSLELKVIATPGHTPGGICLLLNSEAKVILFSGDTLFHHGVGRADFPGASETQLLRSVKEKLLVLADDTVVYPGHGPSSSIGDEKIHNHFLS